MKFIYKKRGWGQKQEEIRDITEARIVDEEGKLVLEFREIPNFKSGDPDPLYAIETRVPDSSVLESLTIKRVYGRKA